MGLACGVGGFQGRMLGRVGGDVNMRGGRCAQAKGPPLRRPLAAMRAMCGGGSVDDGHGVFDDFDDLADVEGFFEEAIEAVGGEAVRFFVGHFAAHGDDFGELEVGIGLDLSGDFVAIDIGEVHIEEHDVRAEAFGDEAGFEAAFSDLDLVLGLVFEDFFEDFDDVLFVVDDEDSCSAGHEPVEGHVMLFHEPDELVEGDTAVLGAGDAVSAEGARVEPFADGPGGDGTDFCYLAGGQDIFHFSGHLILSCCRRSCGVASWLRQVAFLSLRGAALHPSSVYRHAGGTL